MQQDIKNIEEKTRQSLRYSIWDGAFYSIQTGLASSFFVPFAILLKANNIHLGILGTLPQVLGSLVQLFSHHLLGLFRSRKRFICIGALLQGVMLIPIAFVFLGGNWQVYYLLFFVSLYWVFGMMFGPAWNSWMGELVSEKQRGQYFATRNKIVGITSFFTVLLGGALLHWLSGYNGETYIGFIVIFLLAFLARVISLAFISQQYEPEYHPAHASEVRFRDFIKQLTKSDYGTFTIFMCLMNFAVFFSGPFFAPYMLKDLKFDYMTFTIINSIPIIAKFFVLTRWGKICDQYGSQKILILTGFLMPLVPILWSLAPNFYYLAVVQIYSGIVWAGFETSSFSFSFEITKKQQRIAYMSYYSVLNGAAILLGGIVGGLVVRYNQVFASRYLLVFVISGLLRYCVSGFYIKKLKKMKKIEDIPFHKLFFKIVATMPTMGVVYQAISFVKKPPKVSSD